MLEKLLYTKFSQLNRQNIYRHGISIFMYIYYYIKNIFFVGKNSYYSLTLHFKLAKIIECLTNSSNNVNSSSA